MKKTIAQFLFSGPFIERCVFTWLTQGYGEIEKLEPTNVPVNA